MRLAAAVLPRLARASRSGALVLVGAAALALSTAGTAGAAPAGPAAAPVPAGGPTAEARTAAPGAAVPRGAHCALAAGDHQPLRCFGSFPAAISFATGGRVTDAPDSPAAAAADPAFTARIQAPTATLSSTVVGIEWADLNWTGSSLTMYASSGCDNSSDVDHRFSSMPAGWNDRISSFRSYSNCAQQLFRGTSFSGGALTGIISSMSYVGSSANDQASSVTFN